MADYNIIFPNRPMKVSPPKSGIFTQLGGVLVAAGIACYIMAGVSLITPLTQDLVSDFSIRNAARPLAGAIIEQSTCIRPEDDDFLTNCKVTLLSKRQGLPELRREIHFMYYSWPSWHLRDYPMNVVADPSQPEKTTTDLALDKLWNRTATLLLNTLIFLLVGLLGAFFFKWIAVPLFMRGAVVRALSNQVLRQTILRLDSRGHFRWVVSSRTPTGARKSCEWEATGTPIYMDPSQNLVLGVTTGDGTMCMPLDTTLSWIDLTDAERMQMLAQIGPERLHIIDVPMSPEEIAAERG